MLGIYICIVYATGNHGKLLATKAVFVTNFTKPAACGFSLGTS